MAPLLAIQFVGYDGGERGPEPTEVIIMGLLDFITGFFGGAKGRGYQIRSDEEDFRSWRLLAEYDDKTKSLEDFPDFHVAYLYAAYPGDSSEDHATARPEYLEQGLKKAKQKSHIHARLATYQLWNGDHPKAFTSATQALVGALEIPWPDPGAHITCGQLVAAVIAEHGFTSEGAKLRELASRYHVSPKDRDGIIRALGVLQKPIYKSMATKAVDALREAGIVGQS
jgi:hypothetical protein